MKYLLAVTAFVCLCSCAWAWGSSELSCASCGSECQSACGTRHFRACCFNFQRRRRSGPSKDNLAHHERSGLPGNLASDDQGGRMILQELLRLPQVATFIQLLGNRLAAAPSGSPRSRNNNSMKKGRPTSKRELYAHRHLLLPEEGAPNPASSLKYSDHALLARQKSLGDFLQRQILSADPEDDDDEGDEADEEDFMSAYSGDLMSSPLLDLSLLGSSSSSSSSPRRRKSLSQKGTSPMSPSSPAVKTSSFPSSEVSLGVSHLLGRVLKSGHPLAGGKYQQSGNSD